MKSSFLIRLGFILLLVSLIGCGSGGTNVGSQTGSVTAQLQWVEGNKSSSLSSGKQIATAPQGVVTVRIVVSGSDMSNIQQDFPASAGTGVIGGVPVGSNRTLTAQGLDVSGVVTHQGAVNNITVQAGQTTDAGIVVMYPAGSTFTVSGTITLNGNPLSGVTVSLQGTSYSTVTGSDGTYSLTVPNSSYTVVPSITGYTFTPATRSVPDNNGDTPGQDFTATLVSFSQADLTGNWDVITFSPGTNSSNDPNWESESGTIDGQGNYTCTSRQNSKGSATCSSSGPGVISIDSSGTVTTSTNNTFNGNMSLDKNLIVGTETELPDTFRLIVLRKRVLGVTYSSADVANLQLAFYALNGGSSNNWAYGAGSTNASGQFTETSENDPSGPVNPSTSLNTLQIDSNGNVTLAENSAFHGIMTPDKKVIFTVQTKPNTSPANYGFIALLVTGQTFTTANLAGTRDFHTIWDTGWNRGTSVTDTAGNQTYLSYLDSSGNSGLPANDTLSIDASGATTKSTDSSYHGQRSFNKDLGVHTNTDANGHHHIGIGMNLP